MLFDDLAELFLKSKKARYFAIFFLVISIFISYSGVIFYSRIINNERSAVADFLINDSIMVSKNSESDLRLEKEIEQIRKELDLFFREGYKEKVTSQGAFDNNIASNKIYEIDARLRSLENKLDVAGLNKMSERFDLIEKAIGGDVELALSLPRLRDEIKEFRSQYISSLAKLEKNLERASDRMDAFYSILFSAVVAVFVVVIPFLLSGRFRQRNQGE